MTKLRTVEVWILFVIVLAFFGAFFGTLGVRLLVTDGGILQGLIVLAVTTAAVLELFVGFKKILGKIHEQQHPKDSTN